LSKLSLSTLLKLLRLYLTFPIKSVILMIFYFKALISFCSLCFLEDN